MAVYQRVYATYADYVAWSNDAFTPQSRVTWMLARASEDIDRALIGAIYTVDTNNMPTDPVDIDTFNRATCAQAQFRMELGDDTGASNRMSSTSIGGISVTRAAGTMAMTMPPLAPAALQILHQAGAAPISPMTNF